MDTNESLFSLEVHVESVNRLKVSCIIPAVSFRLLDFPSLVIHRVSPVNVQNLREKSQIQGITRNAIETEFRDRYGNITFTKGKSCLFNANIANLQSQLQTTPLYLMLLDVWHKKPKLIGSTTIPLKKTIDQLSADVEKLGFTAPSISQQQGVYDVYNLMGTMIGNVQLCLRILSLGVCLTPHIPPQSIMTLPVVNQQQYSADKVEDNVILDDMEVIDEEKSSEEPVSPTLQSVAVQVNLNVHKQPKTSKYISLPYIKDKETEPVIIANTVCPPPLYYHVMSHKENAGKIVEVKEEKESKVSRPSRNKYADDVDFVFYNPNLVQPDGSCGCTSVCIQTDDQSDLPIAQEKAIGSSDRFPTKFDSEDLPILTALLQELSFLRNQRKDGIEIARSSKCLPEETWPQPKQQREIKLRECCSKLMEEKTKEAKKKRPKTAVLTQKRVKFKQTSLQYGMTKTQLMRLEMNQKGKKLPSNSKLVSSKEDERRLPNNGRKPSDPNNGPDLGRTHALLSSATSAQEQTQDVSSAVIAKEGLDIIDGKEDHDNDFMRTDSADSSSIAASSPTSVEIFLPQMEGDSDVGSDIFDITALDNDNRFAPCATYNKYGHTGIPEEQQQSGESSELKETLKEKITQSELAKENLSQKSSQLASTSENFYQSDLNKSSGQSESAKKSPDQSETIKSKPVSPTSPRKTPDLTRRRSVTSQTARSRTSTALSMYSDDFEECPVWDTPQITDEESSASSKSHSSYHSANSQTSQYKKKHYTEPVKSYYSPLKSKDFDKRSSSKSSMSGEEVSPPKNHNFNSSTLGSEDQFQDSLNSPSKEVITDNDDETEHRNVLQLPKPVNDLGYTF